MGRARIKLKHISNERSRRTTFMQRRKGLIKKVTEFCTMCGVEACLIVYDDGNGDVGPVTWPQDPLVVRSIIEKYERQKNERPPKTFDLQDFFDNRKNMVEAEITKVDKQSTSIKYPTWDPSITKMEEVQMRAFIAQVDAKIRVCDHRINKLKNKHQSEANSSFMQNMAQASASSSHPSQIVPTPMEPLNGRVYFTNSINQVDGASNYGINMLRNMQQSDAYFSFVPNMAQESANAISSQPSQLSYLQNISQSQLTLEASKPLNEKIEMADLTNQVDVPLDTTNQLGKSMDWDNQLGDFEDWINAPIDWPNQLGGDLVGWASQPDESVWQNMHVQSQNEQQGGGSLHALPTPLDEFQTDYYSMRF